MSRKLKELFFFIQALILLGLLVSCGNDTKLSLDTATPSVSIINTTQQPQTESPKLTPLSTPITPMTVINTSVQSPIGRESRMNFLKGIPCRLPCWENIIPGTTLPSESQKILQQNQWLENIRNVGGPPLYPNYVIEGHWKLEVIDKTDPILSSTVNVFYDDKTTPVTAVELRTLRFKFKEFITLYGEPDTILAKNYYDYHKNINYYSTQFFYFAQGFVVAGDTVNSLPQKLNTNLELLYITSFEPTIEGYKKFMKNESNTALMVKWEGFKDWKYYCRYLTTAGAKTCD